jgi:hypothetical protein
MSSQEIGGTHLSSYVLEQLPILEIENYSTRMCGDAALNGLELTYTARGLEAFAHDHGYDWPSIRWDNECRALLSCEMDAAHFRLSLGSRNEWGVDNPELCEVYPAPRPAVDYLMEIILIDKRRDIEEHGDYRTRLQILEVYDRMQYAIDTEEPYLTLLDPPLAAPASPILREKKTLNE